VGELGHTRKATACMPTLFAQSKLMDFKRHARYSPGLLLTQVDIRRWLELTNFPIPPARGKLMGLLRTFRDPAFGVNSARITFI
jgi:hypothetical protein